MAKGTKNPSAAAAPEAKIGALETLASSDEDRVMDGEQAIDERDFDRALRPTKFSELIGQRKVTDNLRVYVQAAKQRKEPLDHVLLCGPPGLGKTTIAYILGNELGTNVMTAHGYPLIPQRQCQRPTDEAEPHHND
jgi:Holliday junction DNA helicase RuvB